MKIIVFGGTGFIGKPLVAALKAKGHEVQLADLRKKSNVYEDIKSSQAVINLGGHPLFKDRWNDRIKSLIYDSRIEGTEKIVNFIKDSKDGIVKGI
jgi:NAD dependent epimerase/dehydratase family enzyme